MFRFKSFLRTPSREMAQATDVLAQQLAQSLTLEERLTGYVYDEVMLGHKEEGHPEQPLRIVSIHKKLEADGLLAKMTRIPARKATEEELLSVHSKKHVDEMYSMATMTSPDLHALADGFNSIYFNEKSLESSLYSAGGAIALIEAIAEGTIHNGIANVRPPGHHAEENEAMGFCTYNNVAVAAALARKNWGVGKIAIIDWDVHWGNGTYHMFKDDPSILYVSTHRFNHGRFYPGDEDAGPTIVGEGEGTGFSVHVGWNQSSIGDGGYLSAFETVIMPICREFNPDMVIVSAGFDAARGDPLGWCDITPAGYAHMTHMLMSLANGKVGIVLEGGYNLKSISDSMAACASILVGDLPPNKAKAPLEEGAYEAIIATVNAHRPYWPSLKGVTEPIVFAGYKRSASDATPVPSPQKKSSAALTPNVSPVKTASSPTPSKGKAPAEAPFPGSINMLLSSSSSSSSSSSAPPNAGGGGSDGVGDDKGFAVEPLPWCPHLDSIASEDHVHQIVYSAPCELCGDTSENWVCLHCFMVGCSRYVREHMAYHYENEPTHAMALSYSDISVWCYACDAYVHNPKLTPFKTAAYQQKFGKD